MGAQLVPSIHPSAVLEHSGGLSLPPSTHIEAGCVISLGERAHLRLGERNTFYPHVVIRLGEGWMETGHEVSLGPGVKIYETRAGLRIGNHCMLAAGVCICGVQHGFDDCSRPMRQQPVLALPVVLEDDVWIGANCVLLDGAILRQGCVIGAGSIVRGEIPAYAIAHGQPATVRGYRS